MAMIEGRGMVPPRPVRVRLTGSDVQYACEVARSRGKFRSYAFRTDQWGRGAFRDPTHPIVYGTLGEIAFARWLLQQTGISLPVDDRHLARGDGGKDFDWHGLVVQVKTARRDYDTLLVRASEHSDASDPYLPPPLKVYVRARLCPPERDDGLFSRVPPSREPNEKPPRVVELCGFVHHANVPRPAEPSRVFAGVWNYSVPLCELLSMSDLADLFTARRLKGVAS
jgi:hypothetical protein